jgi:hypothetical protein
VAEFNCLQQTGNFCPTSGRSSGMGSSPSSAGMSSNTSSSGSLHSLTAVTAPAAEALAGSRQVADALFSAVAAAQQEEGMALGALSPTLVDQLALHLASLA